MTRKILLLSLAMLGCVPAPPSTGAWTDPSPHQSAFVTVNGIRLHYLDWGGSGAPLLFLGGLNTTAHVFDELAPMFTDRFRVLALTRRGIGQSDKPTTGYDTDMLVDDTVAFLDALKIERVSLVGFSLAGVELTRFAALHPERVERLVYLDATPVHTRGTAAAPLPPPLPVAAPAVPLPSVPLAVKISFQPAGSEVPQGYLPDHGQAFGDRGNGLAYGWEEDNAAGAREWNDPKAPDRRFDTLVFMRKQWEDLKWEIALPDEIYKVRVVSGAPALDDAAFAIEAEGTLIVDDDPLPGSPWVEGVATVPVRDGRLTLSGARGAQDNNLCFVEIYSPESAPTRLRSLPARVLPRATAVIDSIRADCSQRFPGVSVEPLVADALEAWTIHADGTIERRYRRRTANLVNEALSLGDLAHVNDTQLAVPALFLRALPSPPQDSRNLEGYRAQQAAKRQKLEAFERNGDHIRVVELADTDHLLFIQRREEVARAMRAFLLT